MNTYLFFYPESKLIQEEGEKHKEESIQTKEIKDKQEPLKEKFSLEKSNINGIGV